MSRNLELFFGSFAAVSQLFFQLRLFHFRARTSIVSSSRQKSRLLQGTFSSTQKKCENNLLVPHRNHYADMRQNTVLRVEERRRVMGRGGGVYRFHLYCNERAHNNNYSRRGLGVRREASTLHNISCICKLCVLPLPCSIGSAALNAQYIRAGFFISLVRWKMCFVLCANCMA